MIMFLLEQAIKEVYSQLKSRLVLLKKLKVKILVTINLSFHLLLVFLLYEFHF